MGFLVFAGKTLAGIACVLGGFIFGGVFVLVGLMSKTIGVSIVGAIIGIIGFIAGVYLLARSRREL